jgi:hypothetical protein
MSILLHHYKELRECISEVERIEARANDNSSKKRSGLTIKEEILTTALDGYFIQSNANCK